MAVIPATKGNFVLKKTGPRSYCQIPIIAWAVNDGGQLRPLTLEPFDRAVILQREGRVYDQDTQKAYDDICDWWAEVSS